MNALHMITGLMSRFMGSGRARVLGLGVSTWFLFTSLAPAQLAEAPQGVVKLTLRDYVGRVLERNESLQVRLLETEIARRRYKGEKGIFEPELVLSYDHLESTRENTAEQNANLDVNVFEEDNNIYSGGLEALVPTGARVRLGSTLRDLANNLGRFTVPGFGTIRGFPTNEYSTFVGVTVTQPLLKNGWRGATLANIRVAALASDVAFQEYRRQLMLLISAAEASYWNLYMAQEQLLFFRESVQLAETLVRDNRGRLEAGRGSELEVLEAESALALRRSRQNEALQKYYEAANRMAMLYSESVVMTNRLIIAVEEPKEDNLGLDLFHSWQNAFENNPDYLAQQKKLMQEKVRLAFAKNQRWPQLDLKASYGLNGLGADPAESWNKVSSSDYPTWSAGVELRIPITGGVKTRQEYSAARLRQQQALLGLKELETQIANSLDTSMRKVTSSSDSVQSYRKTVDFTQDLLDTQLARLDVGRIESRKVLETEADLFEAKNSVVQALVDYRRALIELELVQGTVLKNRNLELNQEVLYRRTKHLVTNGHMSEEQYQTFIEAMQWEYRKNAGIPGPVRTPYNYATPVSGLDDSTSAAPPLTEEQSEEARRVLRTSKPDLPPNMPPDWTPTPIP